MGYMSELHIEKVETTAWYHTDNILKAIECWYPIEYRELTGRLIWDIIQDDYYNNEDNTGNYATDIWDIKLEFDGSAVILNGVELGEIYFKVNEDHSIKSRGHLSVSGDLIRDWSLKDLSNYVSEVDPIYIWRLSLDSPESKAMRALFETLQGGK